MKKGIVLWLILSLTMGLAACGQPAGTESSQTQAVTGQTSQEETSQPVTDETQSEAVAVSYKAGTYTASAEGMRGSVAVEVTFTDDAIVEVKVTEHQETVDIGSKAAEMMPKRIVENQSLAVDSVTAATVTSAAVKAAVADCAAQAGADVNALWNAPVQEPEKKDETIACDVVVVGSGLSGLSAACAAANQGAKVIVVEKASIIGGTSVMAEGYFFSVGESDSDGLYNLFLQRAAEAHSNEFPQENMLRVLADNNTPALDMIRATGVDILYLKPFTSITATEKGEIDTSVRTAYRLIDSLSAAIEENGGQIFCDMPAVRLTVDAQGAVNGVVCESKEGTKTFEAKSVILASGDYANNREMMAEYVPQSANCYTISAVTNTGDGIRMALEVGAVMYNDQYVQGGPLIFNPLDIYRGSYSYTDVPLEAMLVSLDGDRRVGEDKGTRPIHYSYTNKDEADGAFAIMDSTVASKIENMDELLAATSDNSVIKAYKADNLFDLAIMSGMNPEVLIHSVERYNELCAAGEDTDYGKASEYMVPIEEGPFYAVRGYAINRGTLGGIQINEEAQVIDAAGNPIEGLYAAGTIASRPFFSRTYHGGSALGISATMGYVAGNSAVK